VCIECNQDERAVFTQEWQEQAFNALCTYLDNPSMAGKMLQANYNWAMQHSWQQRAQEFLTVYTPELLPSQRSKEVVVDSKGMLNWTHDVPADSGAKRDFINILKMLSTRKNCEVLEVGTFAGTSLVEMMKHLPDNTQATTIDWWKNYTETVQHADGTIGDVQAVAQQEENNIEQVFMNNISEAGLEGRVRSIKADTADGLVQLISEKKKFDFIYVDASHKAFDCYSDLVLSWKLLKTYGIMGIDDYFFNKDRLLESPHEAVNHFISKYQDSLIVLYKYARVFVMKTR